MTKREFIERASMVYVDGFLRGQIRWDTGGPLHEAAAQYAAMLWDAVGKHAEPEPARGPVSVRVVPDRIGDLFR